ncbi:MAG: hypothetical protein HY015_04430 [Bacteroidetes bacterium]|nr:hypothetical protein [Bacteroidota bacterium]MBI3482207.1 hypothetical protein [Bacteroidota bacterium]
MITGGIFKFSIGLIGLSLAILILVWGLIKKDNKKIKRAAIVFIVTWVLLLLIALIELIHVI